MTATAPVKPNTSDVILDACDRLMARYGFRKMTMDDVAQEAGVSKRTIYGHFPNKEELGLRSIGRVVDQVHVEMADLGRSRAPVVERLRSIMLRRVMGRIERVQNYSHSLDELFEVVRSGYMARRAAYFAVETQLISNLIDEGIASGEFAKRDSLKVAESIVFATNSLLPYSLSMAELGTPESIQARLETLIELLLNGICLKPKENQS